MEENTPLTSEKVAATIIDGVIDEAQQGFLNAVEQSDDINVITAAYERLLLALGKQLVADLEEIDEQGSGSTDSDTLAVLAIDRQERLDAYNQTAFALADIADDVLADRHASTTDQS